MPESLLSVLMAARGQSTELARAVGSALTESPDEVLVIDDGSEPPITASRPPFDDRRVKVVRQEARGLTAALALGLSMARGRFVARLDADDECLPGRLQAQLSILEARPEVALVGCGVETVGQDGAPIARYLYPESHEALLAELDDLLTPIPHSTMLFRRAAVLGVGGYRLQFAKAQDYDLLLRLSERFRLASVPEVLVRLRQSPTSMTASREGGEQLRHCVLAFACAVRRRAGLGDPLDAPSADAFLRAFDAWYAGGRYPALFRSRLKRRSARASWASGRPLDCLRALAGALWDDPLWPARRAGLARGRAGDSVRRWALAYRAEAPCAA